MPLEALESNKREGYAMTKVVQVRNILRKRELRSYVEDLLVKRNSLRIYHQIKVGL